MTRAIDKALAIALLAVGTTSTAVAGVQLQHQPPQATIGAPARIVVTIDGLGEKPSVQVHYRPQGSGSYATLSLRPADATRWEGTIPASATSALSLSYYIEVGDRARRESVNLGSAASPLKLRLSEPPPVAQQSSATPIALVGALLLGAGGLLAGLRWNRQRYAASQLFWLRTLFPLIHLDGRARDEALEQMADTELAHPHLGTRRFSLELLQRQLREVQSVDLDQVLDQITDDDDGGAHAAA